MSAEGRITCTPPVIDVDGSLWSVFVTGQGSDAGISIQVCDGIGDGRLDGSRGHPFDGEWHDGGGDIHLHLDRAAAHRLLCQLSKALDDSEYVAAMGRTVSARADGVPL